MRRWWLRWDHPRIRGEHPRERPGGGPLLGSSPHTRGARWHGHRARCRQRIIPAYAGSTCGRSVENVVSGDHPRIRGEHVRRAGHARGRQGSSPHTRGARPELRRHATCERIIPAYAGSTTAWHPGRKPRPDHPRIRGEHHHKMKQIFFLCGSSPHTRGALAA